MNKVIEVNKLIEIKRVRVGVVVDLKTTGCELCEDEVSMKLFLIWGSQEGYIYLTYTYCRRRKEHLA